MNINHERADRPPELAAALRSCRGALIGVVLMSVLLNILYLNGSFFMLQVYDRVIPSRSVATLIALCLLVLALYAAQAFMDIVRGRVLARVAAFVHERLSSRAFEIARKAAAARREADVQPLRDLESLRSFVAGPGPGGFIDLPWMPLYLLLCFLFHPLIGVAAIAGAAVLVLTAVVTNVLTRRALDSIRGDLAARRTLSDVNIRHAEALEALGMGGRLGEVWRDAEVGYGAKQQRMFDLANDLGAFARVFRMMLQSGILALGAYLVIRQEASPGIIIASSIIVSRALAPVELTIAHWRSFLNARTALHSLRAAFAEFPPSPGALELPEASSTLSVENVSLTPPGSQRAVVHGVSFALAASQCLGIIGPSGSGKSSLVRGLVGAWEPRTGAIRLDGATLSQWSSDRLGENVGYLPQKVELLPGTVAQNINRFRRGALSQETIEAARLAGVHDMILKLPAGYETRIGDDGINLSAGQAQRIALARALYGDPFLVVLDEPNSNLDSIGEQALIQAIMGIRFRKGIAVVVAHRPSILEAASHVLVMDGGRMTSFDLRDRVLNRYVQDTPSRLATASGG